MVSHITVISITRIVGVFVWFSFGILARNTRATLRHVSLPSPPYEPGIQEYLQGIEILGWVMASLSGLSYPFYFYLTSDSAFRRCGGGSRRYSNNIARGIALLDLAIMITIFYLLAQVKSYVPLSKSADTTALYGVIRGYEDTPGIEGIYEKAETESYSARKMMKAGREAWGLGIFAGILHFFVFFVGMQAYALGGYLIIFWIKCLVPNKRYMTRWNQKRRMVEKNGGAAAWDLEMGIMGLGIPQKTSAAEPLNKSTQLLVTILEDQRLIARIAESTHFIDISHLSQTCRKIYTTLKDRPAALLLREHSCCTRTNDATIPTSSETGNESECWACGIPVCTTCRSDQRPTLTLPPSERHTHFCRPICSPCFRRTICNKKEYINRQRGRKVYSSFDCHCIMYDDKGIPISTYTARTLCRDCGASGKTEEMLIDMRDARIGKTVKKRDVNLRICTECTTPIINGGPRWWMCRGCGNECKDELHIQWVKKGVMEWVKGKIGGVPEPVEDTAPRG